MKKLLLLIFLLMPISILLQAQSSSKHYVGHTTLFGLKDGIYVKSTHPVMVSTLKRDSKGYFYTSDMEIFMAKGFFSFLHRKKKKSTPEYHCYCLVCHPTTFFHDQSEFVKHMNIATHINLKH